MKPIEIPPHWKWARFREVLTYSLGRTPPRNEAIYWQDGIHPWVSIADMLDFSTVHRTKEAISSKAYEKIFQSKLVPAGTLLMSFKLTIGRVSVLGTDALHNEAIISIIPGPAIDRDFLMFYIPTINYDDHQDRAVKGNTLNKSKIDELPVPVPPLPEQRAIAHTLRTVQDAKEARRRELELERERKAALMQYLFTHGTRGEPRKQTEIGEMPESWEVASLGSLCTFMTGKLNSEQSVSDGQYPFFTCSRTTATIDTYSFDQEAILLAGNNAQGIYSVKHYKGKFDAYQRTYVITITSTDKLDYRFLLYELSRKLEALRRQSLGATTKYLTASIIRGISLSLPTKIEQVEIAKALNACDTKISAVEREVTLLDELFRALLEEMMTGRLSALPLAQTTE